jgi:hypothetical protein
MHVRHGLGTVLHAEYPEPRHSGDPVEARANENARNAMLTLEDLTEEQLNRMKATFARLAERPGAARDKLRDAQEDHQVAIERVKEAKDTITDIEAGARIGMANA